MTAAPASRWCALSASVRGASHVRAASCNQDAVFVELQDGGHLPAVLAVSDGHGSAKCFRSHVGAQLAVNAASIAFREFAAEVVATGLPDTGIEQLATRLPAEIVRTWRAEVLEHWRANPIAAEEWNSQEPQLREKVSQWLESGQPFVAYGATLVSVLRGPGYLICQQMGDGEILVVTRGIETTSVQQPIAADASLLANETTSLCQEDAERRFRCCVQFLPACEPALVLLATDGYPNSFAQPEGFLQVATDLLRLLDEEGAQSIAEALPGWLDEASQQGSGDDVTVAILYSSPFPS